MFWDKEKEAENVQKVGSAIKKFCEENCDQCAQRLHRHGRNL